MGNSQLDNRRCSYVVVIEDPASSAGELRDLANYLSTLGVAGCEVLIIDASPRLQFDLNARTLRWVGRHLAPRPEDCASDGTIDPVRAAAALASCEKVIVAAEDVRYTPEAIDQICGLLEMHEVVEPQDYLEPSPWWSGIEAGRILVHRGVDPQPDHGATLGFRRTVVRTLRGLSAVDAYDDQARRLVALGAEVYPASHIFVRRQPAPLREWLAGRPRIAGDDFALPMKTAFFFSLVPLLWALALLGGVQLAGGYAGVIACASIGLAIRGRSGAGSFFPLYTCLFAPLWVFERSVSVYWALLRKVRGATSDAAGVAVPDRPRGQRVASGE